MTRRPPTDVDTDGIFEDINGDGNFDVADIQQFFDVYNGDDLVNAMSWAFDHTNDGRVTVDDIEKALDTV